MFVLLYCHTLVEDALPMFLINVILLRSKSEGCCEGSGMVGGMRPGDGNFMATV